MELILSLCIFLLVFAGLALGIVLAGRPPQASCGGLSCAGGGCAGCPRRAGRERADD